WYMELYLMLMESQVQDGPLLVRGVPIPAISPDREQREALWQELMWTLSRQSAQQRQEFLEEAAAKFGLRPAWRTKLLDDPLLRERFQLTRLPELMQLVDAEMTIGAHTLSHPVLAEQPAELARLEMAECRKALEKALGRQVWAIAYPFGTPSSAGDREFRMAEEVGYECAFMNVGGSLSRANRGFALPRIHVTSEMSLAVYEAHVSGFHHAMRGRLRPNLERNTHGGR
ncbi:MAG: polysaccharide deacetylase family protein, partial [Terriglobales bacterium]